ncbi:hypothetical protein RW25_28840 [Bacillus sp. L_1B0_8]|nr:hypothetical protein RW25_28840 [Bacillus sp. L_1B0_8]
MKINIVHKKDEMNMLCPVCIKRGEREVEMIPMYDEHPNWILFCRKCDHRHKNEEVSPLPY